MITIAALYKFVAFAHPEQVKAQLQALCVEYGVTGMLIVANEGLNGTIAASKANIPLFIAALINLEPRLNDMEIKYSRTDEQPFYRMHISVKKEIVTLGLPAEALPRGPCDNVHDLNPDQWNEIIARPDTVVLDTRNDYEVRLGSFVNAVNPQTTSFRHFPAYLQSILPEEVPTKDYAIFCTGGIRCDKVAGYMAGLSGVGKVYTLKGGILRYLETVPEPASLWTGECFVFDQRVTVKHGMEVGDCQLCRGCRQPLTKEDVSREDFNEGVHCRYCLPALQQDKKLKAEERQKQMELSRLRNEKHLGYVHPGHKKTRSCTSNSVIGESTIIPLSISQEDHEDTLHDGLAQGEGERVEEVIVDNVAAVESSALPSAS
jgi:UPF0176 protein